MDVYKDPMLNIADAARYLALPETTLRSWANDGSVTSLTAERRGWPQLPFVAAVEAYVLRQLRSMGIPKRNITEAARGIKERLNDPFGLARPGLGVDGRDILIEVAGEFYRGADLQQAVRETLTDFRSVITWDKDNPVRLKLTNLGGDVILDPRFGWGRPVFERNKVPIAALAGQWLGGDSIADIASDFEMTPGEVERVVQGYLASSAKGEGRTAA